MRILLTTEQTQAISTLINLENLRRLNEIDGVTFTAFRQDYKNFDVILFMGYDPRVSEARTVNPAAKIGVVDIRPGTLEAARGADFLVSNGPEMSAMAARYFSNVFEYPIFHEAKKQERAPANEKPVIVTYHGNRAHATSMFPHVTRALEELAQDVPLELHVIYNVQALSPIPEKFLPGRAVQVRTINWHDRVYEQELAQADIGIVPNLTPMHRRREALQSTAPNDDAFGAHPSEYLVRYKATSNAGRILAFAQHGIPVIADMFPSAAQIIRNGENGYLAHDAFSWYQALRTLCEDPPRRREIGRTLYATYLERYTIAALNHRFVDFCRTLPPAREAPAALDGADALFDSADPPADPRAGLTAALWRRLRPGIRAS
ncbi:MAG TPA: glycosyltransferase [Hyphomicrobiaceae bacterium]